MPELDVLFLARGSAKQYLDESGKVDVQHLCEAVGVGPAVLARLAHRETESVAGLFSAGFVQLRHPLTDKVLRQLLQITAIFDAMGWTREDTRRWMKAPLPTFEGKSPLDIIADGHGQELISRLLSLAAGDAGS
jgi:hypothetical protein